MQVSNLAPYNDSELPLKTNIIPNAGFEDYDYNGFPTSWNPSGSGTFILNTNYTSKRHGGTYAGDVKVQGTSQFSQNGYLSPSIKSQAYLSQGITCDAWLNLVYPDISKSSQIYIQIYIANTNFGYNYLYYYLSVRYFYGSNSTNYYNFLANQTSSNTWLHFTRNITSDFMTLYGSLTGNEYINSFTFYISSPSQATGFSELTVDDFSLNGTSSRFLYGNGNFESGNGSYWTNPLNTNTSPAYINVSNDHTEGSKSVNLTTTTINSHSVGYVQEELYRFSAGLFPDKYTSSFSFDWKIQSTENGGQGQLSYFYIYAWNYTNTAYIYAYMDNNLNDFGFSNYTNNVYIKLPGFGLKGAWHTANIDLTQIVHEFNLTGQIFYDFSFYAQSGFYTNSSIQLLIDNMSVLSTPATDPGFEYDGYWGSSYPVLGWSNYYSNGLSYVNKSTFSHTGKYSARVNSTGSVQSIIEADTYFQIKNPNTFTDFWWFLDQSSIQNTNSYAYFYFTFDGYYNLYYIITASNSFTPTNDSTNVYYKVDYFNQSGVWNNLHRNIYNDLQTAFGPKNWNMTMIEFIAYAFGSDYIETHIDDVNFILDTHGPQLSALSYNQNPDYKTPVEVNVTAIDRYSKTKYVAMYTSFNNGPWTKASMSISDTNQYTGLINPLASTQSIRFYLNATDTFGNIHIDNNNGNYYSINITIPSPSLSNVYLSPQIPVHNQPVHVLLAVTDPNAVANTTFWYKIGSTGVWVSEVMNVTDVIYQATIPGVSWNTTVYYYVISENIYGQISYKGNKTSPLNYIVDDLTNPSLTVIGPLNSNIQGLVNFTIQGSDAESGIDSLKVSIDGNTSSTEQVPPSVYTWDTTKVSNGNHMIAFSLSDKAGNVATYELSYNVANPQGLDSIVGDVNNFISTNGVIVGAGGVIAVYAGLKILIHFVRRKKY